MEVRKKIFYGRMNAMKKFINEFSFVLLKFRTCSLYFVVDAVVRVQKNTYSVLMRFQNMSGNLVSCLFHEIEAK